MNIKDCRRLLWSILNLRALVLKIRKRSLNNDIESQLVWILNYCDFIYDRICEIEDIINE